MSVNENEVDDEPSSEEEREKEADLFQAIRKGKLHEVRALLRSGMKMNIIDRNNKNNTPLHSAIDKCKKEIAVELLLKECKTNINAQNKIGDTPLHIAAVKGYKELVQLLLNEQADTSIKNNASKTALELAEVKEIIDMLTTSAQPQAGTSDASGQQRLLQKRKTSYVDDTRMKRLKISLEQKRTLNEPNGSRNSETKRPRKSEEYQASGLKSSLHGVTYQLKLLMLCLKRGVDQKYSFRLATEMDAAEKFDDLVFQYREGNRTIHRFLQAKHKQDESKNISINDLLTQTDGNFSLQKYFTSYRNIRKRLELESNSMNNTIRDLIICTNIGFKSDDKRRALTLSNDIFDTEKDESILKTDLLRFKKDFAGKEEIVSVLQNVPDLVKLAKKLVDCVLDSESNEKIKSKKDTSGNLLKTYQFALEKEVIDSDSKKLRPDFVTNSNNLSPNAKNFRQAFENAFHDRRKTYNLDSDPFIKVEDLDKFAYEIAALLRTAIGNEEIRVEKRKTVIKDNFDKLAGYVLVKKDGDTRFSSAFLSNKKLPGNLDSFRKTLFGEVSKQKIMFNNLTNYRFKVYKDFKTCDEMFVDIDTFWKSIREKELKLFDNFGKRDASLESVDEFVKNLAHLIRESRNKDEENVEIKEGDTTFTKNINKLARHALVEKNGKIYFSREFLEDSPLPENLNEFRAKLKAEVDELGELRFIINNFPRTSLPNDSITDIDIDILSFLNKLVFAVEQPNEIELDRIVINEMSECKDINVIDSEFLASNFEKFILDWMKEKRGRFLTYIDGKQFLDGMKKKLASLKLTGLTLEYHSKMKETNIHFDSDVEELQQFLEYDNAVQLFILMSKFDTSLGLLKVHQTLENIPEYANGNNYIFIRLHSFLRMQDLIADPSGSRSKHLWVIDCKSVEDTEREYEMEYELFEAIKSNETTKFILITDNVMLAEKLGWMFSNRFLRKEIDVNSLLDLEYESRKKIMNERRVKFQGEEVFLRDLIDEESMNLIDTAALTELANNKILRIAAPLQDLGVVSDYYIPRTFKRWEKMKGSVEHDNSKFYVPPYGRIDDFHLLQNQDIVLISDNKKRFKELSREKKYKRYNIHWLKTEDGQFEWQESNGALSKLRELVDKREKSATKYTPTKVNDILNKTVIVAAEPGMGKSTVLTSLALETKAAEPNLWVARINLSVDSSKEIQKRVNQEIRFDENESIDFLLKVIKLNPGFEQEFFKHCYKRGRMVLLFDGFDEISPDYTDKVIELLNFLNGSGINKMWVTTRPYNIKNDLEDKLGLFSHVLEEFSKNDQRRFLKDFWTANLQLVDSNDEHAKVFIDKLIDSFSKSINDGDRKFISIPLQIRMIADIFKDNYAEFCRSGNHELTNEQMRKFERNLNLLSLYESFFKMKFDDIRFGEKQPGWDAAVPDIIRMQKKERADDIKNHKELALLNLYDDHGVEKLIPELEKYELLDNVRISKNKTGIIDRIVDDRPVFVHQSFAEYFAALWFTEKLHDKTKENIVIAFLEEHLFRDESKVIRNFFDRILTKNETNDDKFEIHIAVFNNNLGEIERLLEIDPRVLDTADKAGRTPLHLAAAYGHIELTQNLLRAGRKHSDSNILSVKDELFNWSPLSYADKNGHWNIVELLLQNGADGADMFEAHKEEKMLLHLSAKQGYLEIFKYIVDERNVNYDAVDSRGETPLHKAAHEGHLKIIKYLVDDKNADFNAINTKGNTALHYAALGGHLGIMRYLVDEKNANFDAVDAEGNTPLHCAADASNLEIIKYLIDEKGVNPNAIDAIGNTALHSAADVGNLEIMKYLIDEKKANFNAVDTGGNTLLHNATQWGHLVIMKYLVNEKNANVNAINVRGSTPVHCAARRGNLENMKYLVDEQNANFHVIDVNGETPLHYAAQEGHLAIIEYLVDEKNSDINAIDAEGSTPLHHATGWGNLDVIRYLVDEKNANCNAVNVEGETPLHSCALGGYLGIIRYLVDGKNANFGAADSRGETLLHCAALGGHLDVIKYLVDGKNANFDAVDVYGKTPLHYAVQQGNLEIMKYLIDEKNVNFDAGYTDEISPLHHAAKRGNLEIMRYLVDEKNADYDAVDADENTLLHFAADAGHLEIIKYLVDEKNADLNAVNADGKTPLHCAALGGHLKSIKYLVDEKNANFDAVDAEENTPLHDATQRGNLEIVKYLVDEKNAKIDIVNAYKRSPLHCAALGGHLEIIKYFVNEEKADLDAVDAEGNTPLHCATLRGQQEVIKYLVDEKGVSSDAVDANGDTLLHYATLGGQLETMKYLVDEKSANFDAADAEGNTPLHYAALGGHMEIIKYLVDEKSANFDAINANGQTPLHYAAQRDNLEIIKYFVDEKNADLDTVDAGGNRPLHCAADAGSLEIIRYLVDQKNVNFDAVDAGGNTPLHYAALGGHLGIIEYLVDEKNANFDAVNAEGNTLLHCATDASNLEVIRYLVDQKNVDVDAVDAKGNTPLHYAARRDNLEIIKYLVEEKNANFDAVNAEGNTPLHCADDVGNLEIMEYLINQKNANSEASNQKG